MKRLLLPLIATLAAGCATVSDPVPADYKGPVVAVADTGAPDGGGKGRFFALLEVDGKPVANALGETRSASYGQGFALSARYTTRNLPARPMKVKLTGTHQTAAPIHAMAARMAGTYFSVEGTVDFNPAEGKSYQVVGELAKERSCVWIAEKDSSQPATEKVCTK